MRKLKMIATSMILGTSMVLSSLTGAGAEGISSVRQGSGLPAGLTRLITENDTDISGTFTGSNHIQKTRIQVEKTSRINIRSDASTECTILVWIKYDGKEILSFTISPGSGEEIFLLAGNYDMELECYQQGMLFPEKDIPIRSITMNGIPLIPFRRPLTGRMIRWKTQIRSLCRVFPGDPFLRLRRGICMSFILITMMFRWTDGSIRV